MTSGATLAGLSGYALVTVICCLIVLEKLGIPMPFAPGDFLLVLAGVSIATTHLNPLVVVVTTYLSASSELLQDASSSNASELWHCRESQRFSMQASAWTS